MRNVKTQRVQEKNARTEDFINRKNICENFATRRENLGKEPESLDHLIMKINVRRVFGIQITFSFAVPRINDFT